MEINDNRIWLLITRVLSDEVTASEKEELKQWMNKKPEHQKLFEELKVSWNQEPGDISFLFDHQKGLDKLQSKISRVKREDKKEARISNFLKTQSARKFKPFKIAASILLLVAALAVTFTLQYWEPSQTVYTTSSVEQRIITLPDGSKVRLNANSQITFPENFEGTRRQVTLEGEAFFEVEKNPRKPFVIHANEALIQVLGTAFSVKEQTASSDVMVVVKEGVVSFRPENKTEANGVKLRKGYLGYLSGADGEINVEEVNTENYFSWIHGQLSFDGTPLSDVLTQLERIYGIRNMINDSSLASLRLTAHTNSASLEEVLQMIALSLEISYRRNGDTITWMKKNDGSYKK